MNRVFIVVALALTFVACVPRAQEEFVPIEQEESTKPVDQEGSAEPIEEGPVEKGLRPSVEELLDELGGRDGLRGLDPNTERLIDVDAGNCPIDGFEIPGQGTPRAMGSIGGLAVAPYPTGSTPGDASAVSEEIINLAVPAFDQRTAILVIDDFNGDVYFPDQRIDDAPVTLGSLRERLPEELSARVSQQEQELNILEDIGQLSHGSLFFNHTLSLLRVLSSDIQVDFLDDMLFAEFPELGITVITVDTEKFNTKAIAKRTSDAVQSVFDKFGISRFAINLSFGLVPCSVLEDFRAAKEGLESPALTFERYVGEVLSENGLAEELREQLASLLTTPIENDPLLALAEEDVSLSSEEGENSDVESSGGRVNPVMITYLAAAGNYGYDWSLAPGYWPEFVSVSAENLSGPIGVKDPEYSNTGEVLLPGGFFELTFYDPANRVWVTYPDISVSGTSFAAPVLSVYHRVRLHPQHATLYAYAALALSVLQHKPTSEQAAADVERAFRHSRK